MLFCEPRFINILIMFENVTVLHCLDGVLVQNKDFTQNNIEAILVLLRRGTNAVNIDLW